MQQDVCRLSFSALAWLLSFALAGFLLTACAGPPYPGLPDLPMKDWLNPGEKKKPPKNKSLNIYAPDKVLGMDDLVWLAMEQSPLVSSGMINLEISEIRKTSNKWHYLPSMSLQYTISNNITRYNEGDKQKMGQDYGEPAYQTNFTGVWRNPVETFFSVKAADELLQTAIVTQRKLIGGLIYQIASALLKIDYYENLLAGLEKQEELAAKKLEASRIAETYEKKLGMDSSVNDDDLADMVMENRQRRLELVDERDTLKKIVGLMPEQALKVDAKSVYALLEKFRPEELDWKDIWARSEDRYLLGQQIKLERFNVFLSWARYLPIVNININESPPRGQSQPRDAETDEFLHLYLTFPLLDWGEKLRDADMADARGRQRRLEMIEKERNFGEMWRKMERRMKIAEIREERARRRAANAESRKEAHEIAFANGEASYGDMAYVSREHGDAAALVLAAARELAQARLSWMDAASFLTNYYLGDAGYIKGKK